MADDLIRLDETTRAAVASGRLVHLATINPDGTPQVTCVYVGWDGDEIVAGHLADHVKLRNIRRDPRVTLSVESDVPIRRIQSLRGDQGDRPRRGWRGRRRAPPHHERRVPAAGRRLARRIRDAHLASAGLGHRPVGSRRLVRTPRCRPSVRIGRRRSFQGRHVGRARTPWDEDRVGPSGRRVGEAHGRSKHVDRPEGGRSVVGDRLTQAVLPVAAGERRIRRTRASRTTWHSS